MLEFYDGLYSNFYWLKPTDAENGVWEAYAIGKGTGSWPHGSLVDTILDNGKAAFVAAYHSAKDEGDYPDIFEIPNDPKQPWIRKTLADIKYGEDLKTYGVNKSGHKDIVAGNFLLKNKGNGQFDTHEIIPEDYEVARLCVADVSGNGTMDIVAGEELLGGMPRSPFSRLVWFEQSDTNKHWDMHIIDIALNSYRCGDQTQAKSTCPSK